MREKLKMPKNVQTFVDKYGGIGSKEQDAAFWKEFRKAANAYANVQAKRICDLEHALAKARGQRNRLAEILGNMKTLAEITKQRDRLAEALERIRDYQGLFAEDDPQSIATEALQSITQPTEL